MSPRLHNETPIKACDKNNTGDASLVGRSDLVLAFARVLQSAGQSTRETLTASKRLADRLDLNGGIVGDWSGLQLQATDGDARLVALAAAEPTGVNMDRVARAMKARSGANVLLQPLCAALLAGVIATLAVRFQPGSSLRLVAVCPRMILVPGHTYSTA